MDTTPGTFAMSRYAPYTHFCMMPTHHIEEVPMPDWLWSKRMIATTAATSQPL